MEYDQIQKQLEAARETKWEEARTKKAAPWPGKKRQALQAILKPMPWGEMEWELKRRVEKAQGLFDRLDEKGRMKLWTGLFPQLTSHLDRAWRDIANRPYLRDLDRFPFRAPKHAKTIDRARAEFFVRACQALRRLDRDAEWLAAWGGHLPNYWGDPHVVGWILGSILRKGGPEAEVVRSILEDSINGNHEVGEMGYHVVVALLNSEDRRDWETIANLLLTAQRQEGLRQTILEVIDEANPDAFRYMLGFILEHDLERFSATVRAFDVWLGMQWAGGSVKPVRAGIGRLIELFDDPDEREQAIRQGDPQDAYLALWVAAYYDAEQAVKLATPLLEESSVERRFVALWIIAKAYLLPESLEVIASRLISGAETDPRLQMVMISFFSLIRFSAVPEELFQAIAAFFTTLPKTKKKLDPIVWPWMEYTLDRRVVGYVLKQMAITSPERLIPFAQALDTYDCTAVVKALANIREDGPEGKPQPRRRRKLTPEGRRLMFELYGDARKEVQKVAFEAMAPWPVEEDEVERILSLLHRNAPALRTGALSRLAKLSDPRALEVVGQLIGDSDVKKRLAGLSLANHLFESGRSADCVLALLKANRQMFDEPELAEQAGRLLGGEVETVSLDDCLGLVPPGSRSPLPQPVLKDVQLETPAARACLQQLANLFLAHGQTEIEVETYASTERVLLSEAGGRLPRPQAGSDPLADARKRLPLVDVWLDWLEKRSEQTRDADGLELVRAWAWVTRGRSYLAALPAVFGKNRAWDLVYGYESLLNWILVLSGATGGGDLLVQHVEDALAQGAASPEEKKDLEDYGRLLAKSCVSPRLELAERYLKCRGKDFSIKSKERLATLAMLALDRNLPGCHKGPLVKLFVVAYDAGLFNEYDFAWMLLHPRENRSWSSEITFGPIWLVSGLRGYKVITDRPKLAEVVRQMRERLIEVELTRGDGVTPASQPSADLHYAGGAKTLFKLVNALGRDKIVRQHEWGSPTRAFSFSRLISVTFPSQDDTFETFAAELRVSDLKKARLLEVAMFAPQWAAHMQHALDMPGLEDAIWWIHAHTKQNAYWRDEEIRAVWAARISERTELEAEDLEEGAVDVAWFRRLLDVIGPEGWDQLQKPARYASNSGGHKRAQLFADAMLARVTEDELLIRIDEKRHQDSVRALGLIPLPDTPDKARESALRRYKRLQEFKRESRQFGSQRQASEGRAVEIGMDNLARTAGYRDPRRLQWAMEAEAVADLACGPVEVTADETTVSLAITEEGEPEITVVKKGRPLKNVPAKLRKHEPIADLVGRVRELRRQTSRMRLSLEEAMCRGDAFAGREVQEFIAHPMLRPMVERLVFIGDGDLIGYPAEGGRLLRNHQGMLEAIGNNDTLRIAHPVELLLRGDWNAWQRECFAAERVQPFKQLFREVYPKTAAELDRSSFTRRYAGHQVNPRQALALFKRRQWVVAPEEGVTKTFHDEAIIAEACFQEHFYTPAEIEGLTFEQVFFHHRGDTSKGLPTVEIPDRLFSEVMRDLDLVVSVAHLGGIDLEASASTIEMRTRLLDETCRLLELANVRVDGHHVIIDGTRASYSVHLGSATTRVIPGRMLVIVAVHSQYRGRLFLPFADDDPKTAEVLAKVLLLARDDEIKDPSILAQILR